MGGEPWFYFVPFQADINRALQSLRQREFQAGRNNPDTTLPEFPVDENSPGPGKGHTSIEEAIQEADADGTRSILDMERVSDEVDFGVVSPMSDDDLEDLFGTAKPTREMIESNDELFEALDRGQGVYIIAYRDNAPSEIFFAGYSFD